MELKLIFNYLMTEKKYFVHDLTQNGMGSSIWYVHKIFCETIISYTANTHTYLFLSEGKKCFSKSFMYVFNKWSLVQSC